MNTDKMYIYIDESGTLPDPSDRVIVVAAVGTSSPSQVESIFKNKIWRQRLKNPGNEVKFYTAGEKTRLAALEEIAKMDFAIFILVVDKKGRQIIDSPENFATISWLLIEDVLNFCPNITGIIFDKHFTPDIKTEEFNTILSDLLNIKVSIRHVDSKLNEGVNVADMVAGATLARETGKGNQFYSIIANEVISIKQLNWPEAKKKFFDKKRLVRTGASTHPKQAMKGLYSK